MGNQNNKNKNSNNRSKMVADVINRPVPEENVESAVDQNVFEQEATNDSEPETITEVGTSVVETMEENITPTTEIVETSEEHTNGVVEETNEEVSTNEEESVDVSTPITPVLGKIRVVALVNGSPLQFAKVTKRLKELDISYVVENDTTIVIGSYHSKVDAVKVKKELVGKGLKPVILD